MTENDVDLISDARVWHNCIHEIGHLLHSMTDREMFFVSSGKIEMENVKFDQSTQYMKSITTYLAEDMFSLCNIS